MVRERDMESCAESTDQKPAAVTELELSRLEHNSQSRLEDRLSRPVRSVLVSSSFLLLLVRPLLLVAMHLFLVASCSVRSVLAPFVVRPGAPFVASFATRSDGLKDMKQETWPKFNRTANYRAGFERTCFMGGLL